MTVHRRGLRAAAVGCVIGLALLAGCAADKPKPIALEPLKPQIAGKLVWNKRGANVGFPLSVAVNGGVFTVAANDGTVMAVQADNGRELWRANAGAALSAGVGSDGRFAAVVTRDGELVSFDAGKPSWHKPIGVRVTTAPLVAGERVFVLGLDRSVQAFDALDGRKLWSVQRAGDPLTLAQTGVLTSFNDTLVVGQGARLVGLDPLRGTVRWDIAAASPRGTNEVERLADLVGPANRTIDSICMRAFQAAVTCINADRGTLVWTKTAGGIDGVAGDEQFVFGADASDRLTAWRRVTGEVAWTSDKFLHHGLSTPLSTGQTVVYGDAQGLVHWLSRDKGEPLLRLPTDGSAVVAAPVASGATMLVVTRNGGLFAFRPD
jgi:outer membrane protein assembly factor BamB